MKVKLITFGCKVNQYETQALMEDCALLGWEITESRADLYVVNTCTVTAKADSKSREAVARAKRENPQAKIAVTGCLAQADSDKVKAWGVDHVISQDKKPQFAALLSNKKPARTDLWDLKINNFFNLRAFVKIQDGCDNFCSFCKIPHVRGRSVSRPQADVLDEIKRLAACHKEIVLCGINLGSYGKDLTPNATLAGLLEKIIEIKDLGRVRLSSLEPNLIDDKLLGFLADPKVCPHLHLPFQTGDDTVLKAMNKKETVAAYEGLVGKARQINPDTAISCDIMVGFPAETQETFDNTVNFLRRVRPMRLHVFTFSRRPATAFAQVKIKNSAEVRERAQQLIDLGRDWASQYSRKYIGKTLQMVLEEKKQGMICGYTENYLQVQVKSGAVLGAIAPVKIARAEKNKIYGELCG